ncbi:unnamed protein product [Gordionus sp. m RMFG-2023]|uniref:uncharacterized protein LOC135930393 n=1 Tax=Gordionus sp. m RMFG-2023 TaxID=3053472 RepID=UPI0030E500DB
MSSDAFREWTIPLSGGTEQASSRPKILNSYSKKSQPIYYNLQRGCASTNNHGVLYVCRSEVDQDFGIYSIDLTTATAKSEDHAPILIMDSSSYRAHNPSVPSYSELPSRDHRTVMALKILSDPPRRIANTRCPLGGKKDVFAEARPLVALLYTTTRPQGGECEIVSLTTRRLLRTLTFALPISDIDSNESYIAFAFADRLAIFDSATLQPVVVIRNRETPPFTNSFDYNTLLDDDFNSNPFTLGAGKFLAFSDSSFKPWLSSRCHALVAERTGDPACISGYASRNIDPPRSRSPRSFSQLTDNNKPNYYASALFKAAKSVSRGLCSLGDGASSLAYNSRAILDNFYQSSQFTTLNTANRGLHANPLKPELRFKNIVTVVDLEVLEKSKSMDFYFSTNRRENETKDLDDWYRFYECRSASCKSNPQRCYEPDDKFRLLDSSDFGSSLLGANHRNPNFLRSKASHPSWRKSIESVVMAHFIALPGVTHIDDSLFPGEIKRPVDYNMYGDNSKDGENIINLKFDPEGCLLFVAGHIGRHFQVYYLGRHASCKPGLTRIVHMYTLERGLTPCHYLSSVDFSADSRWISLVSEKGTIHFYSLNCYREHEPLGYNNINFIGSKMGEDLENDYYRSAGLDPALVSYQRLVTARNIVNKRAIESSPGTISLHTRLFKMYLSTPGAQIPGGSPLRILALHRVKPHFNERLSISDFTTPLRDISLPNLLSHASQTFTNTSPASYGYLVRSLFAPISFNTSSSTTHLLSQRATDRGDHIVVESGAIPFHLNSHALHSDPHNDTRHGVISFDDPSYLLLNFQNLDLRNRKDYLATQLVGSDHLAENNYRSSVSARRSRPTYAYTGAYSLYVLDGTVDRLHEYVIENRSLNSSSLNSVNLKRVHTWSFSRSLTALRDVGRGDVDTESGSILTIINDLPISPSPRDAGYASWLPEIEIRTYAGPHRRLWMGPQFSFKTFQPHHHTTILQDRSPALISSCPSVPRSPPHLPSSCLSRSPLTVITQATTRATPLGDCFQDNRDCPVYEGLDSIEPILALELDETLPLYPLCPAPKFNHSQTRQNIDITNPFNYHQSKKPREENHVENRPSLMVLSNESGTRLNGGVEKAIENSPREEEYLKTEIMDELRDAIECQLVTTYSVSEPVNISCAVMEPRIKEPGNDLCLNDALTEASIDIFEVSPVDSAIQLVTSK